MILQCETILIVDDEPNYRALIELQLSRPGRLVLSAGSGAEAISMMTSKKINLIITDMKMPRMDGLDFLIEARKLDPEIPAIIMTGYVIEDRLAAALKRDKTRYLPKPFDIGELDRLVKEMTLSQA